MNETLRLLTVLREALLGRPDSGYPDCRYRLGDQVRVFAAELCEVIGVQFESRQQGLSARVVYFVRWETGSEVQPVSRMLESELSDRD